MDRQREKLWFSLGFILVSSNRFSYRLYGITQLRTCCVPMCMEQCLKSHPLCMYTSQNPPSGLVMAAFESKYSTGRRLQIFVWIDSGHGIQLDQVPELWLLQDWMGKFKRRVNPVALDLPVACQVISLLMGHAPFGLAWLLWGSQAQVYYS